MLEGGLSPEDHLVIHVTSHLIYVSAAGEPMFIKEIINDGILRPGSLIDAEQDETIRRWVLGLRTSNGSVFFSFFPPRSDIEHPAVSEIFSKLSINKRMHLSRVFPSVPNLATRNQ
jgi:hypothetical protein